MKKTKANFWPNANEYYLDKKGYKQAIMMAVRDLMVRTLKKKENVSTCLTEELCRDNSVLFKFLEDWFEEDISLRDNESLKKVFDERHERTCNEILKIIQNHYTNSNGTEVCYGKAQKIVNMTFKYLYCIPGSVEKERHFKFCHVALDAFILEWLYRKSKKSNREELNITRDNLISWSNISADEHMRNKKTIYSYSKLQNMFTILVEELNMGLTPFQAEFYIWPQMQLTLACEHLYSLQTKENLKEFKEKPLKEKLEELKMCIDSISVEETTYFI